MATRSPQGVPLALNCIGRLATLGCLLALAAGPALAEEIPDARKSGADLVRERQLEKQSDEGRSTGSYWSSFEMARAGRCTEAMPELRKLARLGRGYESAQHVYGRCLIETGQRDEGLRWVSQAADAGLADAQATHLQFYLEDGPSYMPHETAAMWLYLYQSNPLRLSIGAQNRLDEATIATLRQRIPRTDYLAGIGRARNWTPTFANQGTHSTP